MADVTFCIKRFHNWLFNGRKGRSRDRKINILYFPGGSLVWPRYFVSLKELSCNISIRINWDWNFKAPPTLPKPVTSNEDNIINSLKHFHEASVRSAKKDLRVWFASVKRNFGNHEMRSYKFTSVEEFNSLLSNGTRKYRLYRNTQKLILMFFPADHYS